MPPPTRSGPPRVFIDSSVLMAAAISVRGKARDLLLAGFRGDYHLVISPLVLAETERNLARKAPAALPAFQDFAAVLIAELVTPSATTIAAATAIIDPKDAPIVAAAVEAGVAFLASYDRKHLLAHQATIAATFGLIVATPDAILATTDDREDDRQ